jgi:hypothetical protein
LAGVKKKTLRASEQEREDVKLKRCLWQKAQASMNLEKLVFIDESGAKTNMTRLYGRAKEGPWSKIRSVESQNRKRFDRCHCQSP